MALENIASVIYILTSGGRGTLLPPMQKRKFIRATALSLVILISFLSAFSDFFHTCIPRAQSNGNSYNIYLASHGISSDSVLQIVSGAKDSGDDGDDFCPACYWLTNSVSVFFILILIVALHQILMSSAVPQKSFLSLSPSVVLSRGPPSLV